MPVVYYDHTTFTADDISLAYSVPIDDTYIAVAYKNDVNHDLEMVVINTTTGEIGAIEPVILGTSTYYVTAIDVVQLSATAFYVTCVKSNLSTYEDFMYGVRVGLLGTTLTAGTPTLIDQTGSRSTGSEGHSNIPAAALTSSKVIVIYGKKTNDSTHTLQGRVVYNITSGGASLGTAVTLGFSWSSSFDPFAPSLCGIAVDSNTAYFTQYGYNIGRVLLLTAPSTTLNFVFAGTLPSHYSGQEETSLKSMVKLADNKALLVWAESDTIDRYYYWAGVITDDGATITMGTEVNYRIIIGSYTVASIVQPSEYAPYVIATADGTFRAIQLKEVSGVGDDAYVADVLSVSGTVVSLDEAGVNTTPVNVYLLDEAVIDGTTNIPITNTGGFVPMGDDIHWGGVRNGSGIFFATTPPAPILRFYQDTDALTERATLNITDIRRGAMLVRSDGTVLVGSGNAADSVVCEFSTAADNYATWTDITDNLGPGPVTSIREV